jgi:hypothetical protein
VGQLTTFTGASRVFELNVRSREAYRALPGHNRPVSELNEPPYGSRSTSGFRGV